METMVLERMVGQYQNLIFSICYRIVGDYFEAQDLTQETFLAAYRNLGSFDGTNEKAWLTRIATNKCQAAHPDRGCKPSCDYGFLLRRHFPSGNALYRKGGTSAALPNLFFLKTAL